jgi:hypothetical protein
VVGHILIVRCKIADGTVHIDDDDVALNSEESGRVTMK